MNRPQFQEGWATYCFWSVHTVSRCQALAGVSGHQGIVSKNRHAFAAAGKIPGVRDVHVCAGIERDGSRTTQHRAITVDRFAGSDIAGAVLCIYEDGDTAVFLCPEAGGVYVSW